MADNQMATGKEIKRLRGKKSASEVADLIGVGVDRLRKWEERDTDPSDTGDIKKVEDYFGVALSDLASLKQFDFVKTKAIDISEKYVAILERENTRLQKDLELSLGSLRHTALLALAVAETNQQLLIELVMKLRKQDFEVIALEVGKENGERYKKLKAERNIVYEGN